MQNEVIQENITAEEFKQNVINLRAYLYNTALRKLTDITDGDIYNSLVNTLELALTIDENVIKEITCDLLLLNNYVEIIDLSQTLRRQTELLKKRFVEIYRLTAVKLDFSPITWNYSVLENLFDENNVISDEFAEQLEE